MKAEIKQRIIIQIKGYMQYMSFEAAVNKVKRNNLGRIDFIIDDVAKSIK